MTHGHHGGGFSHHHVATHHHTHHVTHHHHNHHNHNQQQHLNHNHNHHNQQPVHHHHHQNDHRHHHHHQHHDPQHHHHHHNHNGQPGFAGSNGIDVFPWFIWYQASPGTPLKAQPRSQEGGEEALRMPRNRVVQISGDWWSMGADLYECHLTVPAQAMKRVDGVDYFAIDVAPHAREEAPFRVWRRYSEFRQLAQWLSSSAPSGPVGTNLSSRGSAFPRKHLRKTLGPEPLECRREKLECWLRAVVEAANAFMKTQQGLIKSWAERRDPSRFRGKSVLVKDDGRLGYIVKDETAEAANRLSVCFFGPSEKTECFAFDQLHLIAALWEKDLRCFLLRGRGPAEGATTTTTKTSPEGVDAVAVMPEPSAPPLLVAYEVPLPPSAGAGSQVAVELPDGKVITVIVPGGVVPGSMLKLWYDPVESSLGVADEQDWQALRHD